MKKTLLMEQHGTSDTHEYTIEYWGGQVADVTLISHPMFARHTLATTTKGYTGRYTNEPMLGKELQQHLDDLKKTKLGTPAEMLNYVFLVRDVPRSWTHQAVRTRIGASVVQESTRFIGKKDVYKILVPSTLHDGRAIDSAYVRGNQAAIMAYEMAMSHTGVSNQDARNLLPHSVLTSMFWSLTLRALMGIYNVRWCCQAEPSTWIPVMQQMKDLIRNASGEDIAAFLSAPVDRNESCGFNASFDRPCVWKNGVTK